MNTAIATSIPKDELPLSGENKSGPLSVIKNKQGGVVFPQIPALGEEDKLTGNQRSLIMKKVLGRSEELQKRYESLGNDTDAAVELYNEIIVHLSGARRGTLLHYRKFIQELTGTSEDSIFIGKYKKTQILQEYISIVHYFENILKDLAHRFDLPGFMRSFEAYQKAKSNIWKEYETGSIMELPQIDWQVSVDGNRDIIRRNVEKVISSGNDNFAHIAQGLSVFVSHFARDNNITGMDAKKIVDFINEILVRKTAYAGMVQIYFLGSEKYKTENLTGKTPPIGAGTYGIEFLGTSTLPKFYKKLYEKANKNPDSDLQSMCHTIGYFQDMAKTRPDLSAAYTKISQSEILTKIYEYFAAQRDMNFSEMQDGVLSHSEIVYFLSVHDEEIQKISEWIGKENLLEVLNVRDFTLIDFISELNGLAAEYLPLPYQNIRDISDAPDEVKKLLKNKKYVGYLDAHHVEYGRSTRYLRAEDYEEYKIYYSDYEYEREKHKIKQVPEYRIRIVDRYRKSDFNDYDYPVEGKEGVYYRYGRYKGKKLGEERVYFGYDDYDITSKRFLGGEVIIPSIGIMGWKFRKVAFEEFEKDRGEDTDYDIEKYVSLGFDEPHIMFKAQEILDKIEYYFRSEYPDAKITMTDGRLEISSPFGGICDSLILTIKHNTLVISTQKTEGSVEEDIKKEIFGKVYTILREIGILPQNTSSTKAIASKK